VRKFSNMPPERHRKISAMGGRASGIARRKKRAMREYCNILLIQAFAVESAVDEIREFRQWKKRRNARLQRDSDSWYEPRVYREWTNRNL